MIWGLITPLGQIGLLRLGDDPKKAAELVLEIVSSSHDSINGRFLWIHEPLQAPIPSWDDPVDTRPWI